MMGNHTQVELFAEYGLNLKHCLYARCIPALNMYRVLVQEDGLIGADSVLPREIWSRACEKFETDIMQAMLEQEAVLWSDQGDIIESTLKTSLLRGDFGLFRQNFTPIQHAVAAVQ